MCAFWAHIVLTHLTNLMIRVDICGLICYSERNYAVISKSQQKNHIMSTCMMFKFILHIIYYILYDVQKMATKYVCIYYLWVHFMILLLKLELQIKILGYNYNYFKILKNLNQYYKKITFIIMFTCATHLFYIYFIKNVITNLFLKIIFYKLEILKH